MPLSEEISKITQRLAVLRADVENRARVLNTPDHFDPVLAELNAIAQDLTNVTVFHEPEMVLASRVEDEFIPAGSTESDAAAPVGIDTPGLSTEGALTGDMVDKAMGQELPPYNPDVHTPIELMEPVAKTEDAEPVADADQKTESADTPVQNPSSDSDNSTPANTEDVNV